MPKEFQAGCRVPKMPEKEQPQVDKTEEKIIHRKDDKMVKLGKVAPSFTAPAYYQGKFVSVDLEEYRGKWVVLCFYPGDFTFV